MARAPKPPQPMLAKAVKDVPITFPVYASMKLDGVRCMVMNGIAMSRSLIPIPNRYVQDYISQACIEGLDGELTVGPPNASNLMQTTMSAVMTEEGEPDFTFWVFDFWTVPDMPFSKRLDRLVDANKEGWFAKHSRIQLLNQNLMHSHEELDPYSARLLEQGYEGTMIRSLDGPYKYGRSTEKEGYLRKIKPWETSEAVVIGFKEQYHNANEATIDERGNTKRSHHLDNMVPMGTLGSFILRDCKTNVEFDCGTGPLLTKESRQRIWNERHSCLHNMLTYKHFAQTGVKDKPRFPTAMAFRDKRDMS